MEDVPYIRERWKRLRPMTPIDSTSIRARPT